jgi:hypothetical protein
MALLLTWKPETRHEHPTNRSWSWLEKLIGAVRLNGESEEPWRSSTQTQREESVFLLKQGDNPRGIFGWGEVIGSWSRDLDGVARTRVLITEILDPREGTLLKYEELENILTKSELSTRSSGRRISTEAATTIDNLWIERNNKLHETSHDHSGKNVRADSLRRIGQARFSETVKGDYGRRCAICSISEQEFLVAAHIVRWADDESVRLDPKNGICLCSLHDKAFEHGYFFIDEGFHIVFSTKLDSDLRLQQYLHLKPGWKIGLPTLHVPKLEYLGRHRNRHSRRPQDQSSQRYVGAVGPVV